MPESLNNIEFREPQAKLKDLLLKYMAGDSHEHTVFSNPSTRHEADYTFEQVFNYIKKEMSEGESQIQFVVFAEHPSDAGNPQPVDGQALLAHQQQIIEFNSHQESGPQLIGGVESSIISSEGDLDVPNDILSQMQLVIASKHDLRSAFPEQNGNPTPAQLTHIYSNLMENPNVDVIGHPNRYVGYEDLKAVDWDSLFTKAAQTNTAMEINLNAPMPGWLIARAVELKVPLFIGTDAHTLAQFQKLGEEEQMAIESENDRLNYHLGFNHSFWKKVVRILRILEAAHTPPEQIITSTLTGLQAWLSKDKIERVKNY